MNARIIRKQAKKLLGLTVIAASMFHSRVQALPVVLQSAVNPTNSHTYYLLDNSNWTDAESAAILLGGHLATINNLAENSWVWDRWGTNRTLWIGFNDAAVEGTFVWANGEISGFANWRAGEPNDGNGGEDYAYIRAKGIADAGTWNDYKNLATVLPEPNLFGVVEVVPEPSIGALLAGGSLIGLLAKRKLRAP